MTWYRLGPLSMSKMSLILQKPLDLSADYEMLKRENFTYDAITYQASRINAQDHPSLYR